MIDKLASQAETDSQEKYNEINRMVEHNQRRVLDAFKEEQIGDHHFSSTDGYGYDDIGREALEAVYASVFGGEDALVRPQIVSGTHAISTSLFSLLRPGDELMYITGSPYDTLEEVIGKRGNESGSLRDYLVDYKEVQLQQDGRVNYPAIQANLTDKTKVVGIQRSKGYENRPSFTINDIKEMIHFVKAIQPNVIVFVDNCYGEFVEEQEPLQVGA